MAIVMDANEQLAELWKTFQVRAGCLAGVGEFVFVKGITGSLFVKNFASLRSTSSVPAPAIKYTLSFEKTRSPRRFSLTSFLASSCPRGVQTGKLVRRDCELAEWLHVES